MGIEEYTDGLIQALIKSGFTKTVANSKKVSDMMTHMFMKGVSFEKAYHSLFKKLDAEVDDNGDFKAT